ncbi:hypothetical protein DB346_02825 [Verrucomicrobia bacterium LW23]|nr:hypothetical protein DB346_03830 [Verrucomicrobia bacterium LW23]PTY04382.1 hypothetical protein DB346_02825 [Verrucomicrobia bacterium LW23]
MHCDGPGLIQRLGYPSQRPTRMADLIPPQLVPPPESTPPKAVKVDWWQATGVVSFLAVVATKLWEQFGYLLPQGELTTFIGAVLFAIASGIAVYSGTTRVPANPNQQQPPTPPTP